MSEDSTQGEKEHVSVYTVIMAMVDQMSAIAWQKMGLQPDMFTGNVAVDLSEAKVAIDVATHLATFLEPHLDEDDKRRLGNLIRDLRVNFVGIGKEANA